LLDLQTAKGMAPDDFRVHYYYGRCYLETKELPKAIDHLKKAFEQNTSGQIGYYLALAFVRNKEWQNAVITAEKALQNEDSTFVQAALHYLKSGAHVELGQKEDALASAEKCVELNPEDADYKKHLERLKANL